MFDKLPNFWESLIGVDNYKDLFDKVAITIVACSYIIKQLKKNFVKKTAEQHSYTVTISQIDQSNLVRDQLAYVAC